MSSIKAILKLYPFRESAILAMVRLHEVEKTQPRGAFSEKGDMQNAQSSRVPFFCVPSPTIHVHTENKSGKPRSNRSTSTVFSRLRKQPEQHQVTIRPIHLPHTTIDRGKLGIPSALPIHKPRVGGLVVGSVTTSEYPLLYVFDLLLFGLGCERGGFYLVRVEVMKLRARDVW